jgi:1-acyl-sn-glycerol-3-phosphate acyltransferase
MIGTREAQPIGRAVPRPFRRIEIKISPPMTWERYLDRANDPKVLRQITDEVMFELGTLSGQEYVDTYAVRGGVAAAEPTRVVTADGLASGNGSVLAAAAAAS